VTETLSGNPRCAKYLNDGRGLYEFDDAVRNQEEYYQSAENASGPEPFLRCGAVCVSDGINLSSLCLFSCAERSGFDEILHPSY